MATKKGMPPAPVEAEPDADDMGEPRDFAAALEDAPAEVEGGEGAGLDAEQTALAEEMGMSTAEALALKRFIETCRKGY